MRSHVSRQAAAALEESDFEDEAEDEDEKLLPPLRRCVDVDVPDHLAGSPLCPLEGGRGGGGGVGGGRGICPLHGGRKGTGMGMGRKGRARLGGGQRGSLTGGTTGKREPEIVFDSGDGTGRF